MKLLTASEFRQRARISRTRENQLRKEGRLPYTKIGRRVLYTEEQVGAFFASCAKPATAPPN